jgi:hypothetical protein
MVVSDGWSWTLCVEELVEGAKKKSREPSRRVHTYDPKSGMR